MIIERAIVQHDRRMKCYKCGSETLDATPVRAPFPPNRLLREGEIPCGICGCGEAQHRGGALGHGYTFTRLQRAVAWLCNRIWPTKRALYILGEIESP